MLTALYEEGGKPSGTKIAFTAITAAVVFNMVFTGTITLGGFVWAREAVDFPGLALIFGAAGATMYGKKGRDNEAMSGPPQ